ncbi:hypothetical protein [Candidatus Paracaedibacter symbiosus]|uniref:hypothetical protein n=1 Tax=Candidatus Paracaedibacter symbiosus TaxID=244582 RepID=UPI00050971CA|nr:hypothetical protein [Candidatus Paracaedibacter symbiosus]
MFVRLIFSSFFLVLHFMGTPVNAMGYNSSNYWRSDELFHKVVDRQVLQGLWKDVENIVSVLNYKKLSPETKDKLRVKDQLVDLYSMALIIDQETSAKKIKDTTGEELLEKIYAVMRQFVSQDSEKNITIDQLKKAGRDKASTQKNYIKQLLLEAQLAPTQSQIPPAPAMAKVAKPYDLPRRKVIMEPQE